MSEEKKVWRHVACRAGELERALNALAEDGYIVHGSVLLSTRTVRTESEDLDGFVTLVRTTFHIVAFDPAELSKITMKAQQEAAAGQLAQIQEMLKQAQQGQPSG